MKKGAQLVCEACCAKTDERRRLRVAAQASPNDLKVIAVLLVQPLLLQELLSLLLRGCCHTVHAGKATLQLVKGCRLCHAVLIIFVELRAAVPGQEAYNCDSRLCCVPSQYPMSDHPCCIH